MDEAEPTTLAAESPAAKRKPRSTTSARKPSPQSPTPVPSPSPSPSPKKRSPTPKSPSPSPSPAPRAYSWRTPAGRAARLMLRSLALLFLSLCALEILRLTLTPSPGSIGVAHTNLHPFSTIRLFLRYGTLRQQIMQIGGNIAIGVPLGFLLPQITPRLRGLMRVELVTAVFIALIELGQHFFVAGRSFDVDDLILAALGAAIGYVPLGRMFALRLHPHHQHWWQRALSNARTRRSTKKTRSS